MSRQQFFIGMEIVQSGFNKCMHILLSSKIVTVKIYNIEPQHEITNNVVCAPSKGSDQPAHMRSLIRAFASRLNIL